MTSLEAVIQHNKSHTLTELNAIVLRLAFTFGVIALFASFFHDITLPNLGKLDLGLNNALIQLALLALLINTHNVYTYYYSTLDTPLDVKVAGSVVYLSHFGLAVFSVLRPQHWIAGTAVLAALIAALNARIWYLLRRDLTHPLFPVIRAWLPRSFWHLAAVVFFALIVERVSDPHTYEQLHGISFDVQTRKTAELLIGDLQSVLFAFAAFRICSVTLRREFAVANFPKQDVEKMHTAINAYYDQQKQKDGARGT